MSENKYGGVVTLFGPGGVMILSSLVLISAVFQNLYKKLVAPTGALSLAEIFKVQGALGATSLTLYGPDVPAPEELQPTVPSNLT